MSSVLIAAPDYLPQLKERDEFSDAQAFADNEALRALDVITRQRPAVVALERMFAASSRGAALINRIKADPALAGCEIRIVAHDTAYARVSPPQRTGDATAPAAVAEPPAAPAPPLDQRGTRRAPRFPVRDGVEVMADGNPAALVNISLVGAQVLSSTILRPNQRVRVALPDPTRPIRISAAVAWAAFEMPKTGPRYRAGIEFFDGDQSVLSRFIDAIKQ